MKMEQSVSETLVYKIQTPGNYPKEIIQNFEYFSGRVGKIAKSDYLS
jgi:hypothetical protein